MCLWVLFIVHTAFRNTAIGIIGWGAGRKANESCGLGPTVFSRVTEVKNWIANHTVGDAVFDSKCRKINGELPTLHCIILAIYWFFVSIMPKIEGILFIPRQGRLRGRPCGLLFDLGGWTLRLLSVFKRWTSYAPLWASSSLLNSLLLVHNGFRS